MRLEDIRQRYALFCKTRNWETHTTPRSCTLSMMVSIGAIAGALQQQDDKVEALSGISYVERKLIERSIADVIIQVVAAASACHVDLSEAVLQKVRATAKKYPQGAPQTQPLPAALPVRRTLSVTLLNKDRDDPEKVSEFHSP